MTLRWQFWLVLAVVFGLIALFVPATGYSRGPLCCSPWRASPAWSGRFFASDEQRVFLSTTRTRLSP